MILCLLLLTAPVAQAAVEFIYPAPSSWVINSDHMVIKLNQIDLTAIRISVNGLASELIDVGSPEYRKLFRDYFIAQALWDIGKNSVQVDLFKGGQKVETSGTDIYYAPSGSSIKAPPEFAPNILQVPEKERMCNTCHVMNPAQAKMNSNNEKENPCFICHKKMLTVKYVHGPAGTYSCGYCHSNKGNPKHAVPRRGAALCYECHADMSVELKKRKYLHGPVEAGMCESCHDSHGTQNESQLLMPINELCLSCHGHLRNQTHVVRTTSGEGHPLKGKPDPLKKTSGKEMSCISCHNPHGGDVRYYFINNPSDRMALCQMCHNK
jgi:predicted CXXCH cytochrome family protein